MLAVGSGFIPFFYIFPVSFLIFKCNNDLQHRCCTMPSQITSSLSYKLIFSCAKIGPKCSSFCVLKKCWKVKVLEKWKLFNSLNSFSHFVNRHLGWILSDVLLRFYRRSQFSWLPTSNKLTDQIWPTTLNLIVSMALIESTGFLFIWNSTLWKIFWKAHCTNNVNNTN